MAVGTLLLRCLAAAYDVASHLSKFTDSETRTKRMLMERECRVRAGGTLFALLFFIAGAPLQAQTSPQAAANEQLLKLIGTESKAVRKKDDFETTEAYEKRITENVGREFLVTVGLDDDPLGLHKPKAFSYNADTQTLTVTLVGDSNTQIIKIIDPLSPEGRVLSPQVALTGRYTRFTLVKTGPELEKEYTGQNAMGASANVQVYQSTFSAIALLNVPENSSPPLITAAVKMAPDIARTLSKRVQWRLLIRTAMVPGQKSLVVQDGDYHHPTIDNPIESYTVGHTITASLLKAQLVDPETNAIVADFGPKGGQPPVLSTAPIGRAVMGVQLSSIMPAVAAALGLTGTDGAMVNEVAPDSAAEKAGIRQGDIFLKVAGKDIKGPSDVSEALTAVAPGSSASVTLIRQGTRSDVTVKF